MKQYYFKVSRISSISDGVFAIAMTILVLDLKVPSLSGSMSEVANYKEVLFNDFPSFLAWLVSFAILCRLWVTQHALLSGGDVRSRGFVWLNFVFLGSIAFIPYPTALVSENSSEPFSVIIFSACYALAALALGGMWLLLERQKGEAGHSIQVIGSAKRVIIFLPALSVIASLLSLVSVHLAIGVLICMPFLGMSRRDRGSDKSTKGRGPDKTSTTKGK